MTSWNSEGHLIISLKTAFAHYAGHNWVPSFTKHCLEHDSALHYHSCNRNWSCAHQCLQNKVWNNMLGYAASYHPLLFLFICFCCWWALKLLAARSTVCLSAPSVSHKGWRPWLEWDGKRVAQPFGWFAEDCCNDSVLRRQQQNSFSFLFSRQKPKWHHLYMYRITSSTKQQGIWYPSMYLEPWLTSFGCACRWIGYRNHRCPAYHLLWCSQPDFGSLTLSLHAPFGEASWQGGKCWGPRQGNNRKREVGGICYWLWERALEC